MADAFAAEGAHVVITGRNRAAGERAVAEIRAAIGCADYVAADLGDGVPADASHGMASTALYSATRAALHSLTRAWAAEYGPGTVITLDGGWSTARVCRRRTGAPYQPNAIMLRGPRVVGVPPPADGSVCHWRASRPDEGRGLAA